MFFMQRSHSMLFNYIFLIFYRILDIGVFFSSSVCYNIFFFFNILQIMNKSLLLILTGLVSININLFAQTEIGLNTEQQTQSNESSTQVAAEQETQSNESSTQVAAEQETQSNESSTQVAAEQETQSNESSTQVAIEQQTQSNESSTQVAIEQETNTELSKPTHTRHSKPKIKAAIKGKRAKSSPSLALGVSYATYSSVYSSSEDNAIAGTEDGSGLGIQLFSSFEKSTLSVGIISGSGDSQTEDDLDAYSAHYLWHYHKNPSAPVIFKYGLGITNFSLSNTDLFGADTEDYTTLSFQFGWTFNRPSVNFFIYYTGGLGDTDYHTDRFKDTQVTNSYLQLGVLFNL